MKTLLAHNQLIGTSSGYAVFRDLFEDEAGNRISVPTSREFLIQKERTLPNGRLTTYPPEAVMFAKFRLSAQ